MSKSSHIWAFLAQLFHNIEVLPLRLFSMILHLFLIHSVISLAFTVNTPELELLNLYHFVSEAHCAPEIALFNFSHSVQRGVSYVIAVATGGKTAQPLYITHIKPITVYGCHDQYTVRSSEIIRYLTEMKVRPQNLTSHLKIFS